MKYIFPHVSHISTYNSSKLGPNDPANKSSMEQTL